MVKGDMTRWSDAMRTPPRRPRCRSGGHADAIHGKTDRRCAAGSHVEADSDGIGAADGAVYRYNVVDRAGQFRSAWRQRDPGCGRRSGRPATALNSSAVRTPSSVTAVLEHDPPRAKSVMAAGRRRRSAELRRRPKQPFGSNAVIRSASLAARAAWSDHIRLAPRIGCAGGRPDDVAADQRPLAAVDAEPARAVQFQLRNGGDHSTTVRPAVVSSTSYSPTTRRLLS
jgi:hypothetical protein